MPDMYLRLTGFTYNACRPFKRKTKKQQKNLNKQKVQNIFIKKKIGKAYFQHHIFLGDFKDLPRRKASDKVLRDKAYNMATNPKYDECKRGRVSMVYNFFDKKYFDGAVTHPDKSAIKSEIIRNQFP